MSALKTALLFPVRLVRAWGIGMAKLWKNDLHPHPGVRAGVMIFLAAALVLTAVVAPRLNHGGRGELWAYLAAVVLIVGWVSYLFNHRWRHAFF